MWQSEVSSWFNSFPGLRADLLPAPGKNGWGAPLNSNGAEKFSSRSAFAADQPAPVNRISPFDAKIARLGIQRCAPITAILQRGHHSCGNQRARSEEHTSELQSLMRISYAVFSL